MLDIFTFVILSIGMSLILLSLYLRYINSDKYRYVSLAGMCLSVLGVVLFQFF